MATDLAQALVMAARTDPGMVRSHNEDAVFADAAQGLAILADGMGGYNAGEVAASMATTLLADGLPAALRARAAASPGGAAADGRSAIHDAIVEQVAATNSAIFSAAANDPQCAGMGTTLVLAVFHDNRVTVAHIGDSRLYRLRDAGLQALTRDHSLLQEQIDAGEISVADARYALHRNLVTRALGVDPVVEVEVHEHEVRPGDIYLLCSDGLNDMVEDDDIALTLQALGANLELAATQLVELANDNGGRDNVSAILVKVRSEFPAAHDWWEPLRNWFK